MEKILNEYESKKLLEKHGVDVVETYVANSKDELLEFSKKVGYPLVLKVLSTNIIHKTEHDGVFVDIRNEVELLKAYAKLSTISKSMTVQKMANGFEFSIGINHDETFGKTIMFGIGGTLIELLKDFTLRILPIDREDAEKMVDEIKVSKVFQGYRNIKVNKECIIELLLKVAELVEKEPIKEMDLNPVFVNEGGYLVADARIVIYNQNEAKRRKRTRRIEDISFFFNPKTVAVIGASRIDGKPGNTIVRNLVNLGFKGKIFPINPNTDEVLGIRCYPSILDVEEEVDVAIIAIPSKYAVDAVKQCAKKGVKGIIIISSGFSEGWSKGEEIEREILRISKEVGMRIIGPNTTGVFNSYSKFTSSFALIPELRMGNVGIIAQTGLFVGVLLDQILSAHRFGISKVIGLGNKCDVDECEALSYLLDDEKTKVIGMYLEGINDGYTFFEILKNSNKPIVILKSGKTRAGIKSAISHTASIAVSDEVFNALVKQTGAIRVNDFEEFIDTLKAISLLPRFKGNRIGVIHYTGAGCVTTADAIEENGLLISRLEEKTLKELRKIFPEWHRINNPVDLYPAIEEVGANKAYNTAIELLVSDKNVDCLIVALWASKSFEAPKIDFKLLKRLREKPTIFCVEGDVEVCHKLSTEIEENGFPTYSSAVRAAKILSVISKLKRLKK
ncbi:acyl-CoA synthetase (NDP forming) [Archaeoglobales archaeon]|nr:MAG: acyl-CoA synthetase (NDP forming) [Archaeoglobales archaeon]